MRAAPLLFFLLLVVIIFSSCNDPNEYRVDSAFTRYLARFEAEASSRNISLDINNTGLIIEFASLKNGNAGLTHFENPVRIEIDRTYWNAIGLKEGGELMKEQLIFHELGHGVLKRDHLNQVLENNEWKSIMCGGTKINNRSWNVNYKGLRRDYYIDELFNAATKSPEFSSIQLLASVDTTGYKKVLYLNFDTDNKQDVGFNLEKTVQYETSLDSLRLKFQSFVNLPFMVFAKAPSPINIQNDFSYECIIEYRSTSNVSQYGIVFGTRPDATSPTAKESIEYMTINNTKRLFVGNRTWYSYYTELSKPEIRIGGKNKLKVCKIGGMLYYFINNVYSYSTEIEATDAGNYFGFMVPANGIVYIDNFVVSQKNIASVNVKQNAMQMIEFQFLKMK